MNKKIIGVTILIIISTIGYFIFNSNIKRTDYDKTKNIEKSIIATSTQTVKIKDTPSFKCPSDYHFDVKVNGCVLDVGKGIPSDGVIFPYAEETYKVGQVIKIKWLLLEPSRSISISLESKSWLDGCLPGYICEPNRDSTISLININNPSISGEYEYTIKPFGEKEIKSQKYKVVIVSDTGNSYKRYLSKEYFIITN